MWSGCMEMWSRMYGDAVTDQMASASSKVVQLSVQTERSQSAARHKPLKKNGSSGRTRTYNPPVNSRMLCH